MASFVPGQESFILLNEDLQKVANAHETYEDALKAAQGLLNRRSQRLVPTKLYVAKVIAKVEPELPQPPIKVTPLKPKPEKEPMPEYDFGTASFDPFYNGGGDQ